MNIKSVGVILLLVFLSYYTYRPLLGGKLFSMHDATQPARIIQMAKSLSDGNIPVRWSKDLGYGYGYPLFNFYAPLPYYFGAVINNITNNLINSTLAMYFIGIIIAPVGMYLLLKEFFDSYPAIIGSLIFTYAPYHAVEVYVRGAVGEYWAFGLIPLVILYLLKAYKYQTITNITLGAVFYALLILSHNIIAVIFSIMIIPLVFLYLIQRWYFYKNKKNSFKALCLSLGFGLLLSSFFWMPAILESDYTNISSITTGGSIYQDHFVFLNQLWDSPWGFAGSAAGQNDGMSFKIGKIQILAGISGILIFLLLVIHRQVKKEKIFFWIIVLCLLLVSVFMTLPISLKFWVPFSGVLKYVQFPWRFIVFILMGLSLYSAFVLFIFKNSKFKLFFMLLLTILIIKPNAKYFTPQYYVDANYEYYHSAGYYYTISKISDEYLPQDFIKPADLQYSNSIISDERVKYIINEEKTGFANLAIFAPEKTNLTINNAYFPSWNVYLNGKKVQYSNKSGRINLPLPSGVQNIVLINNGTTIEIIGNFLSALTMLFLIVLNIKNNYLVK